MKAPKWFKNGYVEFGDWTSRNAEKLAFGGLSILEAALGGFLGYVEGKVTAPSHSEFLEMMEMMGYGVEEADREYSNYVFWQYEVPGGIVGAILLPTVAIGISLACHKGIDKYRGWKKELEEAKKPSKRNELE